MKKEKLEQFKNRLNTLAHTLENDAGSIDVWYARDIQKALDYAKWQKFQNVIAKAIESCKNASQSIEDHFIQVDKMVELGSGAKRKVKDFMLTRYACYLIAQNADPAKEIVAFAQSYFAVQTRLNELNEVQLLEREKLKESEKTLSGLIHVKGLPDQSFGRIRSKGDYSLFGLTTGEMKQRLKVPKSRPLADFLHTVLVSGKSFAANLTNAAIEMKGLNTEQAITFEHITNNTDVRKMLLARGIVPENIPAQEDIKKLERRLKSGDKKALKELNNIIEQGNTD